MDNSLSTKIREISWENGDSAEGHTNDEQTKDHDLLNIPKKSHVRAKLKNDTKSIKSESQLHLTSSLKNRADTNDCKITSISALPNGYMLIMDAGNEILKIFDEDLEACIPTEVPTNTVGVACVSDEVIATIAEKIIYFWKMDGLSIIPMDTDKMNLKYTGHAIHSSEEVIGVLETLDNYVQLFNKIGMELGSIDLKSIRKKEIVTGYSICINGKDQRVYVSDRDYEVGTSLLCIGFDRKLQWECPVPASVGGIMEYNDTIFVVSIGWSNIQRLSKDGAFLSIYQGDLGQLPFHMCLQPVFDRVVVTFNNTGRDRNNAKMYKLSAS